jgi:hypothetical protein
MRYVSVRSGNVIDGETMNRISQQTGTRRQALRVCASAAAALLCAWMAFLPLQANSAEPFNRGSLTGSVYLGSGRALDRDYTTLGAGIGYMVADGLMFGVTGEAWFGNDPDIYKFTPEIRYTFTQVQPVKPYVGGFIAHTIYDGLEDRNTYGARGGVYFPFSTNAAFNVGLVYEKVSDCDKAAYRECSQLYPEAGILVSF